MIPGLDLVQTLMMWLFLTGPASPSTGPTEAASSQPAATAPHAPGTPRSWPPDVVTHHTLALGRETLAYAATAGTMTLAQENGEERARVFFIAYTKDGVVDASQRPLTFCFNGGPGSSSVWLHLGAFGPKRVDMGDAGALLGPPWKLVHNASTLLDLTDLVFVDPVTTGFSRAVPPEKDDQFHGYTEDIESMGDFIRLYTTRFKRWSSPKFVAGESYGTTRAAGLAGHLQTRHGLYLNGVILISAVLNFQTTSFARGNDLVYPLFLPTFTATAWCHQRLAPDLQLDLQRTLAEVEAFAMSDYWLALARGDGLTDDEQSRIAERLARYTGLSPEFIRQCNLRVTMSRFTKELLRGERRTVGRLDSRFEGIDADAGGEAFDYDPSYAAIQGPYTAAFNHYVRAELGFESDLAYEILTGRVSPWNYGNVQNRYLNAAETLRAAMNQNQTMRVFVAAGLYDLATPYFAADYTLSHLGLEPELRGRLTQRRYPAGHMMYVHLPSLEALKSDLATFYHSALASDENAGD